MWRNFGVESLATLIADGGAAGSRRGAARANQGCLNH
jgi:hypothetical protein